MNTPGTSDSEKRSIKPWLITGVVFMLLLATFSSVDASLVYIFLGAATFCFYMALQRWISTQPWKNRQSNYQQQERPKDFSFGFNKGAKQQTYQQPRQEQPRPAQPFTANTAKNVPKAVFIAFAAIFGFFFFIVIIGALFGSDDNATVTQYYRDQAELYLNNSQFDSAKVNYRRVLREEPDDIDARMGYGKSMYFAEQYDSAIIMFNGVNELDPDYIDAKLFRGRCYYNQKRYPEATSEVEQLLTDAPDYNEALLLAGDILYAQEKFEEALTKYYEPAYAAGARSMMLCWIMAYIYDQKRNDVEKAIPFYKEALTYDDTVVDIYERLSQITKEPEATQFRTRATELQQRSN